MARLYVCATPIGNLEDASPRLLRVLGGVDLIAAEDTRVTAKLLARFEIRRPMVSCHRHNERGRAGELVSRMLAEDLSVALVSDAGTPGVSDPGAHLVDACVRAGISVETVAGPSAVAAALSVSGFSGTGYAFYGFPPREDGARRRLLAQILGESQKIAVFFESPHRVKELVASVGAIMPGARLCLCCDLTKKHEKCLYGSPAEVSASLAANPNAEKGEYVLVTDLSDCAIPEPEQNPGSPHGAIIEALLGGASDKEAVARAAAAGIARNEAYQAMLEIRRWRNAQD